MKAVSNVPVLNSDFYKVAHNGRILPYFKETVYTSFGKNFFATFIDMWADEEAVCDQEIHHVEENEQVWTIRATANVTGTAGAPVTFTVASSSHNLSGKYTFVQPGYILAFAPIGKQARVTAVDTTADGAHQITAVPLDGAYAITFTTAMDIIVIPLHMRKPGDSQTSKSSSVIPGLAYTSSLMIAGKDLKIEGSDLAKWCEAVQFLKTRSPLDPCKEVDVLWHADLDQMFLEFTQGWAIQFMLGEAISNTNAGVAGYGSTVGYMPSLRARGTYHPYANTTGVTLGEVDNITDKIKAKRGYCTEYGWWSGKTQRRQLDAILGNYFNNGAISYGAFDCNKDKCVNFGFQAFIKNGIEFYLHEEDSFNDPGLLGAAGFNGANTGILMPLAQFLCGGKKRTPIVINYLENAKAGYSRQLEQWDHGVLKPASNGSSYDGHEWHLRAEKGFEMYAPERQWLIEAF